MKKEEKKEKPWWLPAIFLFVKMSGWVALPVILATYIGKYLDRKYNTDPWLFLFAVGVAFLFSMIGMAKNAIKEMKKIDDEGMEKNNKEKE